MEDRNMTGFERRPERDKADAGQDTIVRRRRIANDTCGEKSTSREKSLLPTETTPAATKKTDASFRADSVQEALGSAPFEAPRGQSRCPWRIFVRAERPSNVPYPHKHGDGRRLLRKSSRPAPQNPNGCHPRRGPPTVFGDTISLSSRKASRRRERNFVRNEEIAKQRRYLLGSGRRRLDIGGDVSSCTTMHLRFTRRRRNVCIEHQNRARPGLRKLRIDIASRVPHSRFSSAMFTSDATARRASTS